MEVTGILYNSLDGLNPRYHRIVNETHPNRFISGWIPKKDKVSLALISFFQVIAGVLDLFSVLTTSILVSVYLSPENQMSVGKTISNYIPFVTLSDGEGVIELMLISVFILLTIKGVFSLVLTRLLLSRLSKISKEFSKIKYRQLLNQSLSYSKSTNKVELGYALSDGVSVLIIGIVSAMVAFITEVSLILIVSFGLIVVNKGVGIVILIYFLVIILVLSRILGKRIDKSANNFVSASIKSRTSINDTLFLFREIKTMSKSGFFLNRYSNSADLAAASYSDLIWWQQLPKFIYELALLSALILLGIFTWMFLDQYQAILLGATFAIAGFKIVPAILRLQAANLTLRDFQGRAREIFPLLAALDENIPFYQNNDLNISSDTRVTPPRVELKHVTYGYSGESDVISDLSFVFEPGTTTFLNGKSGSGKTTLCDLIMNFLAPRVGEILFDGKAYLDWTSQAQQRIAFMPQEPHFFVGTIRENLLIDSFENSAVDSEIVRLLISLDLYDHISSLPNGLDTVITDRNLEFSGGQKQRLAIVRTLLMRPNLCIIDEGTSALDIDSEKIADELFDRFHGNCTLIRIAHKKDLSLHTNTRVLNL